VTAAVLTCPACAAVTTGGDVFCEACGADLPGAELPAAVADAADNAEPVAVVDPAAGDAGDAVAGDEEAATPGEPCPACGAGPASIVGGYCGECGIKQPAPRDHIESVGDGVAAVTDRGRRHHRNEDAFAFSVTDGTVNVVVCDGVSTSVNPDEASQRAVDHALAVLDSADGLPPDERHAQAFSAARQAVLGVAWEPVAGLGPPSCTYLAATVEGDVAELANLGDCRAYWLPSDGAAEVLTVDDSWATEEITAGALTEEQAYADPRAHSITRWLAQDGDPEWEPRRGRLVAGRDGRLVVCSDGLWNYALRAEQVAEVAGTGDLLSVARRLVEHANASGGSDNITVVLVELPRRPRAASTGPEGSAA